MFGYNSITGQNYFSGAERFNEGLESLLVTSIFKTLQGEGPMQGRPAIFIRLTHCNLACSFCDTYFDSGDWTTYEQLLRKLDELRADSCKNIGVVITGGEPMLQKNLEAFLPLLRGYDFVQIESNGIIYRTLPYTTILVVSPKVNERNAGTAYLRPHRSNMERADCLKFVLSADRRSPYHAVPDWALQWRESTCKPIYVSPMNVYLKMPKLADMVRKFETPTLEERNAAEVVSFFEPGMLDLNANKLNHNYAANYALKNGLYLTLQQQLYASIA